ncbi:MAG TPA: Sir2 family NAD-dependent protein deacetylase [Stellaceae bacterium]|jgi:NAD-dependent deacetylase
MLGKPPRLVVFTGPGLSRDSGFAPFDAGTMPPGTTLEDVVTREGFERDPAKVRTFYNHHRRELLGRAKPNTAHDALAVLSLAKRDKTLIVTRNIDDLHERAGSDMVLHTHGELLKARCTICTRVSDRLDDIAPDSECPICGNTGHLRPHIVWVGEEPQHIPLIFEALANCSTFVAISAAGGSEPARSFLAEARRAAAKTIELAPEAVLEWVKAVIAG